LVPRTNATKPVPILSVYLFGNNNGAKKFAMTVLVTRSPPRCGMNHGSTGFSPAWLRACGFAAFASLGECDGNGLLDRFFLRRRMARANRSILLPVIHQRPDIAAHDRPAGSFFERHDIPPVCVININGAR
jgi:hypothetical protein